MTPTASMATPVRTQTAYSQAFTSISCSLTSIAKRIAQLTITIFTWIASLFSKTENPTPMTKPVTEEATVSKEIEAVLQKTPPFCGYKTNKGTDVLSEKVRPMNLFYQALFGEEPITQPGDFPEALFAFTTPPETLENTLRSSIPSALVSVSAEDDPALTEVYGDQTFKISFQEVLNTLDSQKIYLASKFPKLFYQALKQAMLKDQIVTLPGTDRKRQTLRQQSSTFCKALLDDVMNDFAKYGFSSAKDRDAFLDLTLYQIGSLVVKTEDFRSFLDETGKIRKRDAGEQDAIRLINACGIRGFLYMDRSTDQQNVEIMTAAFQTALEAANEGIVVFPAVGMGVWRGSPEVYWNAFFNAVSSRGDGLEEILINPRHQRTIEGQYRQSTGEEFATILEIYINTHSLSEKAIQNLRKIRNLYEEKTDVLLLAQNLKQKWPNKIISLFNASDPDVTLGYHVGEYVNTIGQDISTTEENYAAVGTSTLCHEQMTKIHEHPERIIQAKNPTQW